MPNDLSIPIRGGEKDAVALAVDLTARLRQRFPPPFAVTAEEATSKDGTWAQEILVRRGSTVGAALDLKWEQGKPDSVTATVSQSSKRDVQIMFGILVPLAIVGAYLAYNGIAPLSFLPGRKLGAMLGAFLGFFAGVGPALGLRALVGKNDKPENDQLVATVHGLVQQLEATQRTAA